MNNISTFSDLWNINLALAKSLDSLLQWKSSSRIIHCIPFSTFPLQRPVLIYTGSELFINHFLAEYIQSPLTRPSGQRDDSTAILYRYQKMMTLLATIQIKRNYRYSKLHNSKNSIIVIKKHLLILKI